MLNIFQFLENKKGKPIPLEYKLLNNLPLNESDLIYNGDLNLYDSNLEYLPENLIINGDLILTFSNISIFPTKITITKNLYIQFTILSDMTKDNKTLNEKIKSSVLGKIYY